MMNQKSPFEVGTSKCGLIFAIIGAIAGLVIVFVGIWKALIVLGMAAVGYFLGAHADKAQFVRDKVNKWFPPKNV